MVELGLACLSLPYFSSGWDQLWRNLQVQTSSVPRAGDLVLQELRPKPRTPVSMNLG